MCVFYYKTCFCILFFKKIFFVKSALIPVFPAHEWVIMMIIFLLFITHSNETFPLLCVEWGGVIDRVTTVHPHTGREREQQSDSEDRPQSLLEGGLVWNDPFKAPAYYHLNSGARGKLKMGLTRGSKQGSVRRAGSSEGYIFLFICSRGRWLKNKLCVNGSLFPFDQIGQCFNIFKYKFLWLFGRFGRYRCQCWRPGQYKCRYSVSSLLLFHLQMKINSLYSMEYFIVKVMICILFIT